MNLNNNTRGIFVIVISLSLITALTSITYLSSTPVFAVPSGDQQKFTAQLSGDQQVPPIQTNTSGMTWFKPKQDRIEFELNVTDLQGITMAHIHNAKQGENGPPVVPLFKSESPTILINGKLANGNITASMLEGPMAGKQLSDLSIAMSNGTTYVNVHTEQNPNGEIRGQIMTLIRLSSQVN
ncbi:MAG: CHRD domain-containing protein [Nitrososphaeraceae archaeon]